MGYLSGAPLKGRHMVIPPNIRVGPNAINLFTDIIDECSYKDRLFVIGKPFQPSLMFARGESQPEKSTFQVLHSRVGSRIHPQTLDWAGKACQVNHSSLLQILLYCGRKTLHTFKQGWKPCQGQTLKQGILKGDVSLYH